MAAQDNSLLGRAERAAHSVIDWVTPVGLLPSKQREQAHSKIKSIGENLDVSSLAHLPADVRWDATMKLQKLLNVAGAGLKEDGIMGPATRQAYRNAPGYIRRAGSDFVRTKGITIDGLLTSAITRGARAVRETAQTVASGAAQGLQVAVQLPFAVATAPIRMIQALRGPFSQNQARELVERAYGDAPRGVQNRLRWLDRSHVVTKIMIESKGNPRAVAPSKLFHGLTQMGNDAWSDARKQDASLPSFTDGRYDPYWNIRAAFAFWADLVRVGETRDIKIDTWEKLYAAHQQGYGGFRTLVRSGNTSEQIRTKTTDRSVVNNQSRESLAVVARAVEQVRATA